MDDCCVIVTTIGVGREVRDGYRRGGGIEEGVEIAEHRLKAGNGWSGQNGHGEQCDQREEQEKPAGHAGKLPAANVLVNPEDWSGLLRSPGTKAETP
jgi:hypothetical protein